MINPKIFNNEKVLYVNGNKIIFSIGNYLFEKVESSQDKKIIGYYKGNFLENLLSKFNITSDMLRLGFHSILPLNNGIIGIQKNNIIFKKNNELKFEKVFSNFNGSRPLNILKCPDDNLFFGEYFSNVQRTEVKVFKSSNIYDWKVAFTFKPGTIRHIHKLKYDNYRKGIWILTGDLDKESGLWFTNDNFKTVNKVISFGQKSRAVDLLIFENYLIFPMDSPIQNNYIIKYNFNTKNIKKIYSIKNSAFHIKRISDIYFISTVPEPSIVNDTNYVYIYASLDAHNWKVISKFKKNFIPNNFQFITRYPEVELCSSKGNNDNIYGYARSIKEFSNSTMAWSLKDVREYLNEY